jgi:CheY-like chemotaxis protein
MTTILYVEDHPPARLLMQAIIAELTEFDLQLAEDGAEALELAPRIMPALYILDFDLPDTDGVALGQQLHQIHPAPIIFVSAYAESIQEEVFADLNYTYLSKPLDPDHVATILRRTLS